MNAKEELLYIIAREEEDIDSKITILGIDVEYFEHGYNPEECIAIKGVINDSENTIESALNMLDFDYNNGYGIQHLFGKVYCIDENFNCIWFTREEYDGSEWWKHNTIPEFYNAIK